MKKIPAVSVIIPLYNAEKYIAECLDSVLAQTFQDFEVVVVDDCSTDDSVKIVESYAPKFNGRLRLSATKKNSGGGGYVPRNIGLGLSRGDYIFFLDADDFIANSALEKLFSAAQNFDADFVYTGACHFITAEKKIELKRDALGKKLLENGQADKPTLILNAPKENLRHLLILGNRREPWSKLIRRELLVENEISFPKIVSGGDFIWLLQVYCYSKRFLRIPNALYFWRDDAAESVTRKKRTATNQILHWVSAFVLWRKTLNDVSTRTPALKENPIYVYLAAQGHFNFVFSRTVNERMQLKTQDLCELLRQEFANDPTASTVPFLFSFIDAQQKNQFLMQQQFQKFAAAAQKRIAVLENEVRLLKSKE